MNKLRVKKKIGDLVVKGKLQQAMKIMHQNLNPSSTEYHELLILMQRQNSLTRSQMLDLEEAGKLRKEKYKLSDNFLSFFNATNEQDYIDSNLVLPNEIARPILVIKDKEQNNPDFKTYFDQFGFTNTEVCNFSSDIEFEKYQLIVFDNRDFSAVVESYQTDKRLTDDEKDNIKSRIKEMKICLDKTSLVIIHLGEFNYLVSKNRTRMQGVNSFFSLHARIMETLNYLDFLKDQKS